MARQLQEHTEAKRQSVNGWDVISLGLGLGATVLIGTSFAQPKNPINGVRLFAAFALFSGSVIAERCRESDLLSLDKAIEYQKNIKSDRIKFETTLHEELNRIELAEQYFLRIPVDRHAEVAQKLGIAPPNYAARQPDPTLQQVQSQTQTQTIESPPDPTGDFDPEQQQSSGMIFIPADKVAEWFDLMAGDLPQNLIEDWKANPGKGIEVIDGVARIVE